MLAVVLSSLTLVALSAAPAQAAPLGLRPGDLVIADTGHDRLVVDPVIGPDRVVTGTLSQPSGVVVTPEGDILVADTGNARVVRFPADGGPQQVVGAGAWGVSHLALDGAGGVLFSGTSWGGIGRFDLGGGPAQNHVYAGAGDPNYSGLAVASTGEIVAADWDDQVVRIERRTSRDFTRTPVPGLSRTGTGCPSTEPCNIRGLALISDDQPVVTDTGNDLLWRRSGPSTAVSFGTGLDDPSAVATRIDGRLFVADTGNDRIVELRSDGSSQTTRTLTESLLRPAGVAVVPVPPAEVGDVYVATQVGDVFRTDPDGTNQVLVGTGLGVLTDLAVDTDGDAYVSTSTGFVRRIPADGSAPSTYFTAAGEVSALAVDGAGRLLFADRTGVGAYHPDTGFEVVDAGTRMTGLAVDAAARAYAGDGTTIAAYGEDPRQVVTGLARTDGLAWDPAGRLLVADTTAGTVAEVGLVDGLVDVLADVPGANAVAVADDGDLLVAGQRKIVRTEPDGSGARDLVSLAWNVVGVGQWVPTPTLTDAGPVADTANVGTPYAGHAFAADELDGGPVAFGLDSGELPPGLTLSPGGVLGGTPTTAGTYAFRVLAANRARGVVTPRLTIEVGRRLQELAFTSTSPTRPFPDQTYRPTATGGASGQPVTFSVHPDSATVCSYAAGVVTFLTGGTCTVLADQAGDASYEAAAQARQDVYVDRFEQTVSFTSPVPVAATVGGTYTPTTTGGPTANPITVTAGFGFPPACTVDAGVVRFEHVGTCRLTASIAGDDRHWSRTATQVVQVGPGVLRFAEDAPATAERGTRYLPTTTYPTPWIDVDATSEVGVCSIDPGSGEVVFERPGRCAFFLDTLGDPDYAPDRIVRTVTVTRTRQTVVFTTLAPASAPIGATYTPEADGGASGNPVTFTIDPASEGVCSLLSGVVRLDHAGTCVVRAEQAGDADHEAAPTVTQTIEVARNPSSVTVTSPATGVVGQRYAVAATTDPVGGTVGVTATGACRADAGVVVLERAGDCELEVTWPGDDDHEPAATSQTVVVTAASTAVDLSVRGRVLVATVTPVAPGGGSPVGSVEFLDGTAVLGTVPLTEGIGGAMTAVLVRDRVASGGRHEVTARYAGSPDHAAAERTVAWQDPSITASVSSVRPASAAGWYRTPVTVTFNCTAGTAPLAEPCPGPVVLDRNRRAGRAIVRELAARDGTTTSVSVSGLRIDLDAPSVRVRGVRPGRTYADRPRLRCQARDGWSGVDRCRIRTRTTDGGRTVVYVATAWDRAGNRGVVRGSYRLA